MIDHNADRALGEDGKPAVENVRQRQIRVNDKSTDSSLKNGSPSEQITYELSEEIRNMEESLVSEEIAEELFMGAGEETAVYETAPEAEVSDGTAVAEKAVGISLPAALCDDTLLKELAAIPNKMGFKIGEVAEILGIKQYVLRYWETEFDVLKPKKAANNQRYYTTKDVENVFLIRKLLHRDRFSIEGARAALKELKSVVRKEKDWSQVNQRVDLLQDRVENLIGDLRRLKEAFV